MSLIACGMPCIQAIGPVGVVPRFNWPSRSSASRSSTSPSRRLTIALCTGLTDSMRARVARITSRHETWRLRIALERVCAGRSVMSMPLLWPVRMHSDNQLTHDRLADCVAQAVQRPSSWVGSRPLNVTVAVRPEADTHPRAKLHHKAHRRSVFIQHPRDAAPVRAGGWRQLSRQLRSQLCFQPIDVGQTSADTDEHAGHRVTSRRAFLAASIAATASPFVAVAQPPTKTWRIGYLGPVSPSAGAPLLESFRPGLRELGYAEGQNISIDYRWAEGRPDRFPALAVELTQLKADVIVTYNNAGVAALQRATRTIPIVFASVLDPVASGFAASLARPGGNITGLTGLTEEVSRKWVELLREAVPRVFRVAVLTVSRDLAVYSLSSDRRACSDQNCRLWQVIEGAAKAVKAIPQLHAIAGPDEIEHAFANLIKDRAQGLIVLPHAVTNANRVRIASLAAEHRLPGMYPDSEYVEAGGLMSYAPNYSDQHRRAATFVNKILKGAKPADLPIEQPTKFELVVNMKTAKALGLTIPQSVLARADRVID